MTPPAAGWAVVPAAAGVAVWRGAVRSRRCGDGDVLHRGGDLERSKNMTIANSGGRPQPSAATPPGASAVARRSPRTLSFFVDLLRLTRVTPSTPRRRDSSVATWVWPDVQPVSSIAGELIAAADRRAAAVRRSRSSR